MFSLLDLALFLAIMYASGLAGYMINQAGRLAAWGSEMFDEGLDNFEHNWEEFLLDLDDFLDFLNDRVDAARLAVANFFGQIPGLLAAFPVRLFGFLWLLGATATVMRDTIVDFARGVAASVAVATHNAWLALCAGVHNFGHGTTVAARSDVVFDLGLGLWRWIAGFFLAIRRVSGLVMLRYIYGIASDVWHFLGRYGGLSQMRRDLATNDLRACIPAWQLAWRQHKRGTFVPHMYRAEDEKLFREARARAEDEARQVRNLTTSYDKHVERIRDINADRERLDREVRRLRENNGNLEARVREMDNTIETLRADAAVTAATPAAREIQSLRAQLAAVEIQAATDRCRAEVVQRDLSARQENVRTLQIAVRDTTVELTTLRDDVASRNHQISFWQDQALKAQNMAAQLQGLVPNAQQTIKSLQQTIGGMQQQMGHAEEVFSNQGAELNGIRTELNFARAEITSANMRASSAESQQVIDRARIAELEAELATARRNVSKSASK